MDSSRLKICVLILLLLPSAIWLAAGCSSEEATSVQRGRSGASAPETASNPPVAEEGFRAELTLSRKLSRRTGRPIGEADSFRSRTRSYVNARLTCSGVRPDRPYVVHLVWVQPDGKELYRRYAEVVQTAASGQEKGQWRTVITWLDAEDLHKIKRDTVLTDDPVFALKSRLNTSLKRERDPGLWEMRVYLDRRFLLSRSFTLEVPPPAVEAEMETARAEI